MHYSVIRKWLGNRTWAEFVKNSIPLPGCFARVLKQPWSQEQGQVYSHPSSILFAGKTKLTAVPRFEFAHEN